MPSLASLLACPRTSEPATGRTAAPNPLFSDTGDGASCNQNDDMQGAMMSGESKSRGLSVVMHGSGVSDHALSACRKFEPSPTRALGVYRLSSVLHG